MAVLLAALPAAGAAAGAGGAAAGTAFAATGAGIAAGGGLAVTGGLAAGTAFTAGAAGVSVGTAAAGLGTFGTAAGILGTGLTAADILGGVTTIGGGLMKVGEGMARAEQLEIQGKFALAQSEQELARGAELGRQAARDARDVMAAQRVAFLANGLDIGIGTPTDVAAATRRQSDRSLDTTRRNARNRAATQRLRRRALNSEASAALRGGIAGGFGEAVSVAPVLA